MKTKSIFGMVYLTKSLRVKLLTCSLSWLLLFSFLSPKTLTDSFDTNGTIFPMVQGSLSSVFTHFFSAKDFLKNTFPFKTKAPVVPTDLPDESENESEKENEWNEFATLFNFNFEWIQKSSQTHNFVPYTKSDETKIKVPLFVLHHAWKSFIS